MISDGKMNKGIKGVYLLDGAIHGTQLAVSKVPTKFQRFLIKKILGWGFATINELTKKK